MRQSAVSTCVVEKVAPRLGLEPRTYRLTAGRSTIELSRIDQTTRILPYGYPPTTICSRENRGLQPSDCSHELNLAVDPVQAMDQPKIPRVATEGLVPQERSRLQPRVPDRLNHHYSGQFDS